MIIPLDGLERPIADARAWMRKLDAYREPRKVRAISELAVTILCYVVLCGTMLASLQSGAWCLYALLILPAAGTLVRLFAIQHDSTLR